MKAADAAATGIRPLLVASPGVGGGF